VNNTIIPEKIVVLNKAHVKKLFNKRIRRYEQSRGVKLSSIDRTLRWTSILVDLRYEGYVVK